MNFTTFENLLSPKTSEEGVVARFYDRAVKSKEVNKDGLPVFKDVCYVEIRIKDNLTEVYDQPADRQKIERFPAEYARYQNMKKQVKDGSPLEQFAFLTASEIEALKLRGIFTVEALAALDKEKARQLELLREKELAEKFIHQAQENKKLLGNSEQDCQETIRRLNQKITQLKNEIARLKKGKK